MEDKNALDNMFATMDETVESMEIFPINLNKSVDRREELSSDSNSEVKETMELVLKPVGDLRKNEREYPAGYQPLTPCSNNEFVDSRGRKYYMAMDRSLRRI